MPLRASAITSSGELISFFIGVLLLRCGPFCL